MRYLIVLIVYALIGNPMGFSAEALANDEGCNKSMLAIVGKKEGKDFRFKMGESLRINATGGCATLINNALVHAEASTALKLYLDDVSMANLPVNVSQGAIETDLILTFHLSRKSDEEGNHKAWDTLMGKQHGGLVMTPPVALAIGSELARSVQSASPFQLYIAEAAAVWGTLVVGLAMFLGAYYYLVTKTTALQDANGYYSLGKSQMAFWGLMVVLTFAGIWLITDTMERIPQQVLILLGISGATGLSAIVIGENKKAAETAALQSLPPPSSGEQGKNEKMPEELASAQSAEFWRDICDDGNGMSFHRLQVVIWTGVLGVVFVYSVMRVMSMPEFPETLLILMGISNGTYLGFKIPEKTT